MDACRFRAAGDKTMTLVSIITPAYNAQATLPRAVRSVLAQTHQDWEMIIVSDDGCDYEALLKQDNIADPRLRFSTTGKVKSGPSRGRNIALDLARGEYITTLDADDEYHPDYISTLLKAAEKHGVAMVMLAHKMKPGGEKMPLFIEENIDLEAECMLATLDDYIKINGRTVTFFARKHLQHRYLESISYSEDFFFDLHFFQSVDVIPVFHEKYYIYHYNAASLTSTDRSDESFIHDYKSIIRWLEADTHFAPELKNKYLALYHHRLFQNYLYINAKAQGQCRDFYDFMAKFPQHFR